jgi:phosphoribosylcarboxyaminoimidazole (NCAIR) mutase
LDIRLILGSVTDKPNGNIFLEVLKEIGGIRPRVSIASCHRNIGGKGREFEIFIDAIRENIIIMLGGLSLAAPGIIESLDRNNRDFGRIVFAVPTDKAALSAVQDLPKGTAIITCGLNQVSSKHSIINSALSVAKLAYLLSGSKRRDIHQGLAKWYDEQAKQNPLVSEVELVDGLLPIIK